MIPIRTTNKLLIEIREIKSFLSYYQNKEKLLLKERYNVDKHLKAVNREIKRIKKNLAWRVKELDSRMEV